MNFKYNCSANFATLLNQSTAQVNYFLLKKQKQEMKRLFYRKRILQTFKPSG